MEDPRSVNREAVRAEARSLNNIASALSMLHQEKADFWQRLHFALGIPSVVLAAVAGTSALSDFDNSNILAGVLALVVAILSALLTWLNPQDVAQRHARAAQGFLTISLRARRFERVGLGNEDDAARASAWDSLTAALDELTASSPNVSLIKLTKDESLS